MERVRIKDRPHVGKAIECIRKLRGYTQKSLANQLGISKQAVSKLEQSEVIYDTRLKEIADALGVTVRGLKAFKQEAILKNNSIKGSAPEIFNEPMIESSSFKKIIELYECLLKCEQEKVHLLLGRNY
jgi:transcriptional regulator with XRE-family HTH domain